MNREEKIKKWLAGELSESERKEFESTDEFVEMSKLLKNVNNFKAPEYDVDAEYGRLSDRIIKRKSTFSLYDRISPVLKIAAILIIALTIGYFSYDYINPSIDNEEWISEQTELYLPDSSYVSLNAGSEIRFSDRRWKKERNVELRGEAFFKVKEGSQFKVKTDQGTVTVLGTEFNVKEWQNYFHVSCYSGLVEVAAGESTVVLQPNTIYRIVNGEEKTFAFSEKSQPDWLYGESSFSSVPLKFVINELERQYKVSVETRNVDLSQRFTGSFTHEDLQIALKSITLPLDLNYEIKNSVIVITFEGS
jgi:transmembrane sensor